MMHSLELAPYTFHYNSDLSGNVVIDRIKDAKYEPPFEVPGWMLIELVGRHVSNEMISKIEDMSGVELLKALSL